MIIIVISGSSDRHRIPVLSVTADAYDNGTYLIGYEGIKGNELQWMQPHGWLSSVLCRTKEDRSKRLHTILPYLYGILEKEKL